MIVMQGSAGRHRVPNCMRAGAISVRGNIDRLAVSVNGIFARAKDFGQGPRLTPLRAKAYPTLARGGEERKAWGWTRAFKNRRS